jgi:hypothetical protein
MARFPMRYGKPLTIGYKHGQPWTLSKFSEEEAYTVWQREKV